METYSVELAETLAAKFEVRILALPGRPDGSPPGLISYAVFLVRAMLFCLVYGRAYRKVVLTDLILFPAAICHRLIAPNACRIVVVHGLDLVYQQRKKLLSCAYGLFFRIFVAFQGTFSSIVANSRNTATLAERAGLKGVVVINPSLPSNDLTKCTASPSDLPPGWPVQGRRILYFGRLVPRKGALWFARAVLPSLPADCTFVVAGHAPDPAYGDALRRCERTLCLGRASAHELAAMIRAADLVVMPNIATPDEIDVEGFGLAAVEAAALGGRLLAASIDGISDAVADGITGRLLPSGEAMAWVDAIQSAFSEPVSEAERGRISTSAMTMFSRDQQLDRFLKILSTAQ